MKPASVALFVLALVVAMAWPLTAAIGAARAGAEVSRLLPASCTPDETAAAPSDDGDDAEDGEALMLPPGHPSITGELPPGHPPISADGLPPGHPPVPGALPPGHPRIPSGHGPGAPAPGDLFGAPILLTI